MRKMNSYIETNEIEIFYPYLAIFLEMNNK
jgi:hypothetical protein